MLSGVVLRHRRHLYFTLYLLPTTMYNIFYINRGWGSKYRNKKTPITGRLRKK
jgi:hypothetical protein